MFREFEGIKPRIVDPEIYSAFITNVKCAPVYEYFTYPEWLAYKGFEKVYKETKGDE